MFDWCRTRQRQKRDVRLSRKSQKGTFRCLGYRP